MVPADHPRLNLNENPRVGIHFGVKTAIFGPLFDHTAWMEVRVGCLCQLNLITGTCRKTCRFSSWLLLLLKYQNQRRRRMSVRQDCKRVVYKLLYTRQLLTLQTNA